MSFIDGLKRLFGGSSQGKPPAFPAQADYATYMAAEGALDEATHTQEDYEQYMQGFRLGFPLVGEPPIAMSDHPQFQRGLAAGRAAFDEAGRPVIRYEE